MAKSGLRQRWSSALTWTVALLWALVTGIGAGTPNARADLTMADPASHPSAPRANVQLLYLPILVSATSCSAPALTPLVWDARLGPGGLQGLEGVRIASANPAPCGKFWRAAVVLFEDYYESGGNHHIYVKTLDESGNRIWGQSLQATNWAGVVEYPQEKSPTDSLCDCNFDYPMWANDTYRVQIAGSVPSDIVAGMLLPGNQHVNYRITFQRVTNP